MDSVALVGMGQSWREALHSKADEIWGINYIYELMDAEPDLRIDRVFDIHELGFYKDSMDKVEKHKKHWDHLTSPKPYRFFAPLPYEGIPNLEVYPIWDVVKLTDNFGRYTTEEGEVRKSRLFTSSFDYLMGLAIWELLDGKQCVHGEGKRIECYGWSMGWMKESETEYRYQLPGTAHWIGIAIGRGIEVVLDKQTDIFKSKMYTYEGASMITRQTLEAFKHGWELQLQAAQAEFHSAQAKLQTFAELVNTKPQNELYKNGFIAAQHKVNEAWKYLMQIETGIHVIDNLLTNVDTNEIDLDLQSRMIQMVDGDISAALRQAGLAT